MPISKENKALYPPPKVWKAIRASILERAHYSCERCGAINYTAHPITGSTVILTIAHYPDPDPANVDPSNLRALCQKCHNTLDAPMRAEHRKATRATKRAAKIEAAGQLRLLE